MEKVLKERKAQKCIDGNYYCGWCGNQIFGIRRVYFLFSLKRLKKWIKNILEK